jgi:hypothetical protein
MDSTAFSGVAFRLHYVQKMRQIEALGFGLP